jgi:hypothetical protein
VTSMDIAQALLEKSGVDLNRRRISQQTIRELGEHEVPVRLGSEKNPVLRVFIVREEELESFIAARQRGEEGVEVLEGEALLEEAPELAGERIRELVTAADAATQTLDEGDEPEA